MTWKKKGALWMLAAVLLWTAAPAFACLPGMHDTAKLNCCRMMQDCSRTMGMGGSCCQMQRTNTNAAPVTPYAPEQGQPLGILPRPAFLQSSATSGIPVRNPLEAPPPSASPGGSSILRI